MLLLVIGTCFLPSLGEKYPHDMTLYRYLCPHNMRKRTPQTYSSMQIKPHLLNFEINLKTLLELQHTESQSQYKYSYYRTNDQYQS